jgi:hypothetical protein
MAAANESQGLKIAVAAFITLTVILTVSSYFLYSNGASAEARREQAEESANVKGKAASDALNRVDEMRTRIGVKASEHEPAKDEIAAFFKKEDERLNTLAEQVNAAVQKAQANGAQGPELEETKQNVQRLAGSIRSEPNKTFISMMDRMTELMDNLALLTTELSLNYVSVRDNLTSATDVKKKEVDVQVKNATDSHNEVLAEQKKHGEERGTLLTKVDQLQTALDKTQNEVLNLTKRLKDQEDDFARQRDTLTTILREQRDKLEKNKEIILDRPDGFVTYVDYETREILVSINRGMGARPQMKMTIFDARSPGIPTEKPKGSIELTSVGDKFSTAKIIKTENPIDPIRVGDIVYSAAWSPNQPMRFALIGKLDVNRDSRDDREELKRMIREAGGVVEYDLPPLDLGKETGSLSPRIDWYVTDEREPIRQTFTHQSDSAVAQETKLKQRVGEVTKEARLNGIRPMTIGKLLAYLGYDMNASIIGRTEVVDPNAMRRLTEKRRVPEGQPKATAPAAKTDAEPEMKKDEPAPDEDEPKAKAKAKAKTPAKKAEAKKDAEGEDQ